MPAYVATRIGDALNEAGQSVKGADILILGVAYKQDVGDIRESPSLRVMSVLQRRGARLSFHDPFASVIELNGAPMRSTELSLRDIESADCVAVLTPHSAY